MPLAVCIGIAALVWAGALAYGWALGTAARRGDEVLRGRK